MCEWEEDANDIWTDTLGFTDLATEEREETLASVKTLIRALGEDHPEVFNERDIDPSDYQRELKDAIFSLGGTFRQSHGSDNETIVRNVFLEPAAERGTISFTDQRDHERIDFKGRLADTDETFALDVKGGEGQSIGHLLVPDDTDTLVLWSERNARNTKPPRSRLNEVINRTVRWGVNHNKHPRYMVIRDPPAGERTATGQVIPDIIVFPTQFPTKKVPSPEMPSLEETQFPRLVFETLIGEDDLATKQVRKHIWWHELQYCSSGQIRKQIYNAHDEDITLPTQPIDVDRISDVGRDSNSDQ